MRDFINEHFNVLTLVILFLAVLAILFHAMHHSVDAPTLNWLEHIADQIIAALLGMMTGYRLAMATNGNGQPPVPPPPSPPAPVDQSGKLKVNVP